MRCLIEISASQVKTEEQVVIIAGVVLMVIGSVYESVYAPTEELLVLRSDVELDKEGATEEINDDIIGHLRKFPVLEGARVLCHFVDPDRAEGQRQVH